MIQIAVLGYGNIGNGVTRVIDINHDVIMKKTGLDLGVKCVLDLREFPGDPYENKVVHDIDEIVNDPEIQVVCETMGGKEPAFTFSKKCLEAGKSVCTSNKELVAAHGPELLELAAKNNCNYLFEASVGGGIPLIRTINNALTAEKIEGIQGILNGTTNYMLTKMEKDGADYDEILAKAQELGYAERNPEADVCGHDAGRKIAILTSLALGKTINYDNSVFTEGITKITATDFLYVKGMGRTVKLLGNAAIDKDTNKVYSFVAPFVLKPENPLSMVNDVFNGVLIRSNMLGETMYYGKGAGKLATASAVVGDVVDCLLSKGVNRHVEWVSEECATTDHRSYVQSFLVRVPSGEKAVAYELFDNEITQVKPVEENEDTKKEFAFVTKAMSEKEFDDIVTGLTVINRLRVEV